MTHEYLFYMEIGHFDLNQGHFETFVPTKILI